MPVQPQAPPPLDRPTLGQPTRAQRFFKEFASWLRYVYFLRFSILLWWFPVILVLANSPSAARSLVSGIITPVTPLQYLCVTFFLISSSLVALILAHVVVINGHDRFGDDPPGALLWLLNNPKEEWEWVAPALSQFNNFFVWWYFLHNGATEQVDSRFIWHGIEGGVAMAAVFWYVMSALYYLVYRRGTGANATDAKTLIFPRMFLRLSSQGEPAGFGDVLERAELPFTFDWVARLFPTPGYRCLIADLNSDGSPRMDGKGNPLMKPGQLYEGHFFSLMATVGFYALYWVLYPLTAPVLVPYWAKVTMGLYVLAALSVCGLVVLARVQAGDQIDKSDDEQSRDRLRLRIWKFILCLLILGFAFALPALYYLSDPERFPVLGSVLILVISMIWTFGGLAFMLDRFRIPVLTVFLVVLLGPRMVHWPSGQPITGAQEEHYLSYTSVPVATTLPTPGQVLDARLRLEYCSGEPCKELPKDAAPTLIVVTSTGGGIHAAAWTTAVLGQLENEFSDSFHQHVLLLSTVSGGSVGLYDYLRELDPATNGGKPDWTRMTKGARCSSLEAVGWGLIYYDIPKAVIPLLPSAIAPSSGAGDLDQSPLGKDRTWSLRKAMTRNLNDPFCTDWDYSISSNSGTPSARPNDPHVSRADVAAGQQKTPNHVAELTLAKLRVEDEKNPLPAFTMNTTTVEGGNRFLLANYFIKRDKTHNALVSIPAYSFLDLYGALPFDQGSGFVDLPLATAAQLSATFPYVSSAATLKAAQAPDGVHFVDGGYYDNDGTVSAIEFLRYALDESTLLNPNPADAHGKSGAAKTPAKRDAGPAGHTLRVLLVEIRNSPDGTGNAPLVASQDQGKPWNVMSQIVAPGEGFWSAGHDSITGRNRNALGLLEGAYKDKLLLEHFVIDDQATAHANPPCVPANSVAADPLNWYLTPCQQTEVDISALQPYNTDKYKAVKACFADGKSVDCPRPNREDELR